MRILTLFLVCLLLPSLAVAAPFSVPATDKSVALLGYVLGPHVGSVYLGGYASPALMHMFEVLNFISLTIGTIIVTYIGVVSTINTAQEGKAMGKKFSSSWIPMRGVLGMLLMVPTPTTGYSIIQASVMWLILQGIGAADQLWNTILVDLSSGLSPTTPMRLEDDNHVAFDQLNNNGIRLTQQLLRSAVCMSALNEPRLMSWEQKHVKWYNGRQTEAALANGYRINGSIYIGIKGDQDLGDICGRYDIDAEVHAGDLANPNVGEPTLKLKAQEIYYQKQLALHFMFFDSLLPVAQEIVKETAQPRDQHAANSRLIAPFDNEFLIQPAGGRKKAINAYINTLSAMTVPQQIDNLTSIVEQGRKDGWISAGSFYFTLNMLRQVGLFPSVFILPAAHNIPVCDEPNTCNVNMPDDADHVLNDNLIRFLPHQRDKQILGTRLWDAHIYLENDDADVSTRLTTKPREIGPQQVTLQENMLNEILPYFTRDHVDPIIAQGQFGLKLMSMSEESWQRDIDRQRGIINQAAQNNDFSPEIMRLLDAVRENAVLNLSFFGILWTIGATLAIYVPLIPYMMFIVATVGWFLLVIEAIVAAPILAVSFILPAGEELGKIMHGLMLLLNIILRPTLMLFGFVLASRLYRAVIELVNYSIVGNLANLNTSGSKFAWVAIVAFYGAFILALSNKCFSLIYAVPDKILRWMGGGPEHTDASQELGLAKGSLSKGADTINKIATGYGEREIARLRNREGLPPQQVLPAPNNNPGGRQDGDGDQ